MYIRPTEGGLQFVARSLGIGRSNKDMRQQPAVNAAIKELSRTGQLVHEVSPQHLCGYSVPGRFQLCFVHKAVMWMFGVLLCCCRGCWWTGAASAGLPERESVFRRHAPHVCV